MFNRNETNQSVEKLQTGDNKFQQVKQKEMTERFLTTKIKNSNFIKQAA